ncbi:MAG: hypothetical protein ACHQ15_09095 [Candidatus Limnocylindrales bacterium]
MATGQVATVTLAVGVTLATWPVAIFVTYLVSRAILQGSTLSFPERLAQTPFLDFAAPQFLPAGPFEIAALALFGWLGAR